MNAPQARRRRRLAGLMLLAFVAACGAWLSQVDYRRKIATNILDLVPADERSPELALVRSLADNVQARVALFALSDPAAAAPSLNAAARRFADSLAHTPAFSEAVPLSGGAIEERFGRVVFENRYALLLPGWLAERRRQFEQTGRPAAQFGGWLADRVAADLEAFLARPEAGPAADLALADPLLLTAPLIEDVRALGLSAPARPGTALVWALEKPSPFAAAGQQPAFAAVDAALTQARSVDPRLALQWTGISRFAAASRSRIEAEIRLLNALSLAVVVAAGCLFVRRVWKLLHLVPVVGCSMLGAWTVSTLLFAHLHILVFAIGSLLSGVAVDYGFYIFLQPYLGPEEDYGGKLRRLIGPLLASCLTTVAGFSLLLFSDLPLIRQVGLFVSAGLLTALGAACAYFALLRRPYLETRAFTHARLAPLGAVGTRAARVALAAAAVLAAIGLTRLHWNDDIRELDLPHPGLEANDQAVRALFGESGDRTVYVTYGPTPAGARARLGEFLSFLAKRPSAGPAASLGQVLPTQSDYEALPGNLARLPDFEREFRAALSAHGFLPQSFAAFFADWDRLRRAPPRAPYSALYAEIIPAARGPLQLMYGADSGQAWFLTIVQGSELAVPPALHTVSLNQLRSLNTLFRHYRGSALTLSLVGLALILLSVFLIYPVRPAARIAAIPAGSCLLVFGWLGIAGVSLNLFNLLGAFLAFCLAHNYSILSSGSAWGRVAPPVSIRLSAVCAGGSFAVLALSHIPVVHALGLTVALIVATAAALVEAEPILRRR